MNKIIASLSLYWHYILDIILTHVFVIACIRLNLFTVASILMSADSLFKVVFGVLFSRFSAKLSPHLRGRLSLIIRLMLIILWFVAISQLSTTKFYLPAVATFVIFKLVLLFDSNLSADFVFSLREYFNIDLSRSASAQNILIRSSTAVAPAIALTLLTVPHAKPLAFLLAILIACLSFYKLKQVFFAPKNKGFTSNLAPLSFTQLLKNPLMKWGLIYQISANLAFAGVAFLLLSELNPHGSIFINQISALYAAFFIGQGIVLIYGEVAVPAKTLSHVSILSGLCGIFVITAGMTHGLNQLIACLMIGFTYSFAISAVQKTVTSNLQGKGFIEYVGWAQMIGRFTSFASTSLMGIALTTGFKASSLLIFCGMLGLANALALFQYRMIGNAYNQQIISENL